VLGQIVSVEADCQVTVTEHVMHGAESVVGAAHFASDRNGLYADLV
jgi:hypothetical protein